jgi:hypothetical protein
MVDPSADAPLEIRKFVHGKTWFIEKAKHVISVARLLFVITLDIGLSVKIVFSLII